MQHGKSVAKYIFRKIKKEKHRTGEKSQKRENVQRS